MKNGGGKWTRIVLSGAFALICSVVALFLPLYAWIDNVGVALMVNGCFGTDRISMYLNPALCRILEALTAVSTAALAVYDMCKAVQKDMVISDVRLLKQTGGVHGDFERHD